MLTIDNLNEQQIVTIIATGKLTREDYALLLPDLENMFEKFKTLHFFILLKDFSGFELGALWEDIKFDHKNKKQYGKTAIVGNRKWEAVATKISSLFFQSEMKFFYEDQKNIAWSWIND